MPRFYLRYLRARLAVREPPRVYAGVPVPQLTPVENGYRPDQEASPPAVPEHLETALPPDVEQMVARTSVEPGEGWGEPGETPASPIRRRRRRRRRGRGAGTAAVESTAGGAEAGVPAANGGAPAPSAPADEHYLPDVPPSSFLAEMVQRGDLVLPERGRQRRGSAESAETTARDGAAAPSARTGGQRLSPIEEMIARQNVLFDQLLQRQTALLKAIERMMTVLERRGGPASGGGTLSPMPRVAIFVDVPNIVYAAERIGVQIDWGKVLNYLTRDRQLVRATAYAPISDDTFQRLETQKFVQPFYNLPYRILTKPLKRFGNGEIKANFDVELAIDALTMADRLDIICLVSGDGDFRRMVELVQAKGVRVEVVAFGASTAGELRVVADDFIDISQHLHEFTVTK